MQQTILDDNVFVFCSFLKMSMISRSNVTGYESHACDYYQVTATLYKLKYCIGKSGYSVGDTIFVLVKI